MAKQRITVGYVELTQDESDRLFEQVKKSKGIDSYGELQSLMEDYDATVEEPVKQPLKEVLDEDEAPEEASPQGMRYINIFNAIEADESYRIEASNQE
ncbi:hypothetical protein BBI15_06675 [Planococcus plakortidis]|uniref:Uncharacterized protein n=1 Tax=Planococcus plakortidis TaxID=1038856 RepID=A0A1C7E863_9BACL|nr:hypothetical protein [Planococcus plakortidis]ANU19919.1 hypothetical protein BBI15_06675 [Planococcus plakortidis]